MNARREIAYYRRLTSLYPKSFRDEYRNDLVATFAEQLRDEGAARTWLSTLRDLTVTVPSQHLETHMNRPSAQTVAVIASSVTAAALIAALISGTGPVVGVFLLIAVASLVVATLGWKAARPAAPNDAKVANRWRPILAVGVALLVAAIVTINVPPYNNKDLPEPGWAVMMIALVTGVALITVGLTMAIARRPLRQTPTQ